MPKTTLGLKRWRASGVPLATHSRKAGGRKQPRLPVSGRDPIRETKYERERRERREQKDGDR